MRRNEKTKFCVSKALTGFGTGNKN